MKENFYSISEAALLMGCSESWLREKVKKKEIPSFTEENLLTHRRRYWISAEFVESRAILSQERNPVQDIVPVKEAARFLKLQPNTIYKMVQAGRIKNYGRKRPRRVLVSIKEIETLLEE